MMRFSTISYEIRACCIVFACCAVLCLSPRLACCCCDLISCLAGVSRCGCAGAALLLTRNQPLFSCGVSLASPGTWIMYPMIWVVGSEGTGALGMMQEVAVTCILDIIAKVRLPGEPSPALGTALAHSHERHTTRHTPEKECMHAAGSDAHTS